MNDDPSMPPLGPPYTEPRDRPPPARFPDAPPTYWSTPPAELPSATPVAAPPRVRWLDEPRHQAVVWGAIAIVFAVIIGALVGASAADRPVLLAAPASSSTASQTDSSSERASTTTTEPPSLSAVIVDIELFVERERGLEFKEHVPVRLAAETEFERLLLGELDSERTALLEEQEVLRATGLVPPNFDLVAQEKLLLSVAVAGFYDPTTKVLVVRAANVTPFVREVIAHELTHALDDQWFDLRRPQLDTADDESSYAFSALVEGNARRVEDAYVATMSAGEQIQAATEQAALLAQHPEIRDLPSTLLTLEESPYADGSVFVEDLLNTGGQARLDAAFATPPTTSEHVLEPSRFIAGEVAVAVPAPNADRGASNAGVLGELLLREMLFDALPSVAQVQRAIAGWGGDAYTTWIDASGKTCLRDTFVGDTQGDTNELVDAISQWGTDHAAVIDAPAEGPATFTVCS